MIAVVDSFCEFCGDHVATCCNLAMQWESGTSPILPQMDTNGPQGSVGSVQDLWQDAVGCSGFIRVYWCLLHMTSAYVRERPTMLPTMLRPCQLQRCKTWALRGPASKSRGGKAGLICCGAIKGYQSSINMTIWYNMIQYMYQSYSIWPSYCFR